jgi:bacterioferritin
MIYNPYAKGIQDKVDRNEIIQLLRGALSDEFISAQNYWMQSKLLLQGPYHEEIQKELLQHMAEERKHADWLIDRILHLGSGNEVSPEIKPMDWDRFGKCRYIPAIDWDALSMLNNAIAGERCATDHYAQIAEFTRTRDPVTYDLVQRIMDEEFEHIRDLSKLQDMLNDNEEKEKNSKGSSND